MTVMYLHEVRAMVHDCLGQTAWKLLSKVTLSDKEAWQLPVMAYGMAQLEKSIYTRLDELSKEDGGE